MSVSLNRAQSQVHETFARRAVRLKVWFPLFAFGVLWLDLFRQLSFQWSTNDQYSYGWFVPFLGIYLLWRRWTNRPSCEAVGSPVWMMALVALLLLLLLPLRVISEVNQDWPLINWMAATVVVGISLYAVFLAGGWIWVRHFAFPIIFILVAVRWPYRIEHNLTQELMRIVAGLTVEALSWLNIPALRRGNLIEIGTGVVGIDEACSGVRSLQSTFMAALFLGELYRLRWGFRLACLIGGLILAFVFNVTRALVLSWHASVAGTASVEKWHDPTGMTILLACFGSLWIFVAWLRKRDYGPNREDSANAASLPALPKRFLLAVGCWSVCLLGGTEFWYRWHEARNQSVFGWTVSLPREQPSFGSIELPERARRILAADFEATGKWQDGDGSHWMAFFFRWSARSTLSMMRARVHRPDVCLPASGFTMRADHGLDYFQAGDLALPFRRYTFEEKGRPMYVFFCQWEDTGNRQTGMWKSKQADRIRAVLAGRRRVAQQTFEIIVAGFPDLQEAEKAVKERLPQLIRLESPVRGSAI